MSVVAVARNQITALLQERGAMTAADIDLHLDWTVGRASNVISNTRYTHPKRFFRKVKYLLRKDMTRGREIPVYAAEQGDDEPRPSFGAAASRRRNKAYRDRRRSLLRVTNALRNSDGIERIASPWNGLLPTSQWESVA